MSKFLKILGVLSLVSCIIAAMLSPLSMASSVTFLIAGCLSFGLLYGFGEVIDLLREIAGYAHDLAQKPVIAKPDEKRQCENVPEKNPAQIESSAKKKHDLQPVDVDRNGDTMTCPVCGQKQRSNRNVCMQCGVRFK